LELPSRAGHAGLNQQNEAITNLVAQRDDFVKKYNDSVKTRNEVVSKYNDLVNQLQKQQSSQK
jgi:ABC-type transporter Mla subunit MlaD